MKITLATLPQATAQQVFNHIANHLLTQDQKAVGGIGCMYRTPGGLMCAAGCCIGEDEYSTDLEGTVWSGLADDGKVPKAHSELIRECQKVHDLESVESWYKRLKEIASDRGLTFNYYSLTPLQRAIAFKPL